MTDITKHFFWGAREQRSIPLSLFLINYIIGRLWNSRWIARTRYVYCDIYIASVFYSSLLYRSFVLPTCTLFGKHKTQGRNIDSSISSRLVTILWSFCTHTTNRIKTRWSARARTHIRALTSVLTGAGAYPINSDVNVRNAHNRTERSWTST